MLEILFNTKSLHDFLFIFFNLAMLPSSQSKELLNFFNNHEKSIRVRHGSCHCVSGEALGWKSKLKEIECDLSHFDQKLHLLLQPPPGDTTNDVLRNSWKLRQWLSIGIATWQVARIFFEIDRKSRFFRGDTECSTLHMFNLWKVELKLLWFQQNKFNLAYIHCMGAPHSA